MTFLVQIRYIVKKERCVGASCASKEAFPVLVPFVGDCFLTSERLSSKLRASWFKATLST